MRFLLHICTEHCAVRSCIRPLMLQGMDDQALEVLKAAKATEDVLAGRTESLAAARAEYERKQKEVLLYTSPCCAPWAPVMMRNPPPVSSAWHKTMWGTCSPPAPEHVRRPTRTIENK